MTNKERKPFTPEERKLFTAMRSNTNMARFVEAMLPARILLWIMWVYEHDKTGVATPEMKATAGKCRKELAAIITASAVCALGRLKANPALDMLEKVIDLHCARFTKGKEQKTASWMAIMTYRLACGLIDAGLIHPMQEGSPMANAVDAAFGFVTEEDLGLFDKYATKAANEMLASLCDPKTYGLYRCPVAEAAQNRVVRVAGAVNDAEMKVVME